MGFSCFRWKEKQGHERGHERGHEKKDMKKGRNIRCYKVVSWERVCTK